MHSEKIEVGKAYPIEEAVQILTELASAKFCESVDVSINLGVDPRKSDQVVRGATVLPNGTGKDVKVAVFAQGEKAEEAKAAGADIVGMDDLAASVKEGNLDFGVVIATPDAMRVVGQLGQILGPRGLMPNPQSGYGYTRRWLKQLRMRKLVRCDTEQTRTASFMVALAKLALSR